MSRAASWIAPALCLVGGSCHVSATTETATSSNNTVDQVDAGGVRL